MKHFIDELAVNLGINCTFNAWDRYKASKPEANIERWALEQLVFVKTGFHHEFIQAQTWTSLVELYEKLNK